eukprot:9489175-Pyramimonas_sp.AAC.1
MPKRAGWVVHVVGVCAAVAGILWFGSRRGSGLGECGVVARVGSARMVMMMTMTMMMTTRIMMTMMMM